MKLLLIVFSLITSVNSFAKLNKRGFGPLITEVKVDGWKRPIRVTIRAERFVIRKIGSNHRALNQNIVNLRTFQKDLYGRKINPETPDKNLKSIVKKALKDLGFTISKVIKTVPKPKKKKSVLKAKRRKLK